jgi:beta-mannosidase
MPSPEPLGGPWFAASCEPDALEGPGGLDRLEWIEARVPGTAAAALRDAGRWAPGEPIDLDAEDWWFRISFEASPAAAGEELVLHFDGIATLAEVFLNGEAILASESMFQAHEVDVGAHLREGGNELAIRCLALGPLLETPRKPRARWRTKLAANGLRFHRTMLLGRMPGPAPGPGAVGPWGGVELVRRRGEVIESLETRAKLDGNDGVLEIRASLRAPNRPFETHSDPKSRFGRFGEAEVVLSGASGEHRTSLEAGAGDGGVLELRGALTVPDVARWWPHTHGEPVLHDLRLTIAGGDGEELAAAERRVGFREIAAGPSEGHDAEAEGLDLQVNGIPVFARGAVWTPVDPIGLAPDEEALRTTLECLRDAGFNMLRLPGTGTYESAAFHDLCDELGLLVWQDFMFANLDYPVAEEGFRAVVEGEAREALAAVAWRPSLAVLCGNSEVEQQVAMLGLGPEIGRGELFGELLPGLAREAAAAVPYLPSAPCGGELPFRTNAGVANYFGVGGYKRPLEDARRADVRFASECLAIANLGDDDGADATAISDAGVDWDFGDVRDHYLELLHGVDPEALCGEDPERYAALSREVSGEVMAAVFGEWRRAGSASSGGLVLWSRDLAPGAGWGLLDHEGRPKVALHHLRRALAPRAVWMTDEGLNGIDIHLANDRPEAFVGRLRVACYRDFEQAAGEAIEELELGPREGLTRGVEALLGRFADVNWAYRFGPPAQNLVVASLEEGAGEGFEPVSRAFRFPVGPPREVESADRLGLTAELERGGAGAPVLRLESRRFVHGLRVAAPGLRPADDAFSLEPGTERRIALVADRSANLDSMPKIKLSALNLDRPITLI